MTDPNHQLQQDLTSVLHRLSDNNFKYSMVLRSPDGLTEHLSSNPPDDPQIMELLSKLVIGLAPTTPVSNAPSSSTTSTSTTTMDSSVITTDQGVQLHRAIHAPSLRISTTDTHEVECHIRNCLRELQQVQCKTVAKSWIRVVEPRKQTNHPYKLGELSKPPWWPTGVKHVEPDHLNMKERLTLMVEVVLRTRSSSVEALWRASAAIGNFTRYQHAILNEILFVARAWRLETPKELMVTDWDNCPQEIKKQTQPLFKLENYDEGEYISTGHQGTHQRVVSLPERIVKREDVIMESTTGSSTTELHAEETISPLIDHGHHSSNDNYDVNPVVAFDEDLKRFSLLSSPTSHINVNHVGSLSLHGTDTMELDHSSQD